jgi:hypothetical protein
MSYSATNNKIAPQMIKPLPINIGYAGLILARVFNICDGCASIFLLKMIFNYPQLTK